MWTRRGQWLAVTLLALLPVGLLVRAADEGDQPEPIPAPTGQTMLAVPGQITHDTYGLYLVDLEKQTICVYQYAKTSKKLRLLAARTYAFDTQLDDYNTEPSPRQVRELVQSHRRLTDPTPEAEPVPADNGDGEPDGSDSTAIDND
ncbi:MAG: hypothetical protein ACYS8X_08395 [Planctomycetota bacterium]